MRCTRWLRPSTIVPLIVVAVAWPIAATATEYPALHLYQEVEFADVIVIATVTDASRAMVRVNETLKGAPPRTIHLVEYIDGFLRPADQRPLVNGSQELMFLQKKDEGYGPLQTQFGRWPMRNRHLESPGNVSQLGLADYRKTIARLVDLQAKAKRGGGPGIDAYLEGLRSSDLQVQLWAAHSAYGQVDEPPARLIDAYLDLWSTRDGELRGSAANAIIKWRVRKAAPMLAATLRDESEWERVTAARALGGTGDSTFLPQLRAAAASDESEKVRAYAYEGLTHLLGRESIPDLVAGATDASPFVRGSVAIHAFNMGRTSADAALRADVRELLIRLSEDRSADVSRSAQSFLKQLEKP